MNISHDSHPCTLIFLFLRVVLGFLVEDVEIGDLLVLFGIYLFIINLDKLGWGEFRIFFGRVLEEPSQTLIFPLLHFVISFRVFFNILNFLSKIHGFLHITLFIGVDSQTRKVILDIMRLLHKRIFFSFFASVHIRRVIWFIFLFILLFVLHLFHL